MSDRTESLPLDDAENCECWLLSFEAHCRSKTSRTMWVNKGTSPKTDKFIERCGAKALLKIISMLPGKDVEKLEFEVIKIAITNYIQPRTRLVIADHTNFLQLSQSAGESEKDFKARSNEASVHCQWDSLQNIANDELINAERPKDKTELSRFLGMANYYGRFTQNFEICSPLHDAKKSMREHLTWDGLDKTLLIGMVFGNRGRGRPKTRFSW